MDSAVKLIKERLSHFVSSIYLEVQERASFLNSVINISNKSAEEGKLEELASEYESIFVETYKPVSKDAIYNVPIPEGLDLEAWIGEPLPPEESNLDIEPGQGYGSGGIDDPDDPYRNYNNPETEAQGKQSYVHGDFGDLTSRQKKVMEDSC